MQDSTDRGASPQHESTRISKQNNHIVFNMFLSRKIPT